MARNERNIDRCLFWNVSTLGLSHFANFRMSFGINNTTNGVHLLPLHIPELRFLIASSCIILYSFGYTGCILSIITFSSRKLRHHSTGFLFLIMAFVDILNLFASLQYFLDVIYEINVYSLSIHWCRFFTM